MNVQEAVTADSNFNREFRRALITLVVPIAIQNLITASVNFTDIFMLGLINQSAMSAMSAVSLAAQVTFVLTLFYMGLSTGASILAAQYWGRKDIGAIQRVLSIACTFSVTISVIFFGLSLCIPDLLMRIFTNNSELIRYGTNFLRAISFSYLAMSLSQVYLSVVKSMENSRLSASISSICLILNVAFDALCIFVFFPGMPEKAVIGVAVSTVCARFIELGCCIFHSVTRGQVRFHLPVRDRMERSLRKDFLKYTAPVQANFIVWGCALAANSVASVVKNLAIVLCGGISNGGSILVGKYLGTGKKAGNKITLYALIFGALAGITILLIKPLVFHMMDLNGTAQEYLNGMLYICAYYCVGKSLNSTVIGGIFCAGGDPKFGFWCDTIVMWASYCRWGTCAPLSGICIPWPCMPFSVWMNSLSCPLLSSAIAGISG